MNDITRKQAILNLQDIIGSCYAGDTYEMDEDTLASIKIAINSLQIDEQYDLMYEELDFVQPKKVVGRMIDIKVLEDIKAEIIKLQIYKLFEDTEKLVALDELLEIIDKHMRGTEDE